MSTTILDRTDSAVQFPALTEAQGRLDAKRKALFDIFQEAGPDFDMSKVKSLSGDSHDKVTEIRKMNEEIDDLKAKVTELTDLHRAAANAAAPEPRAKGALEAGAEPGSVPVETKAVARKGFAELICESTAVKGYTKGAMQGPIATIDIELKTLFQESGGIGWAPQSIRTGTVIEFATRPAPLVVDVLPQTTTQFPAVVYMEETTFTNAAAETAEGGSYAEAALGYTERSVPVQKIAVFLPATDEQFEDMPRAQQYIENRLPFMIRQRLDSQILVGSGTAPNLKGLENVSGTNSQPLGSDPLTDAVYKGLRRIRDTGFADPNAILMAPSRWENIALLKTADGVYIWGHPAQSGPTTLWGVQVIQTTAGTASNVYMGDFAHYSELSVRRGIDIQMSNSHDVFFAAGKLAIRADVRCAVIWYRPSAFTIVSGA